MPAYMVVEIEVTDKEAYALYRPAAQAVLAQLGGSGRVIIRGGKDGSGKTESLEGGWMPERFVVIEFPDMQSAKAFYHSVQYQEALKMRMASSRSRAFFVEGE
jgi:uncharacterized protein (DUF1330 family)